MMKFLLAVLLLATVSGEDPDGDKEMKSFRAAINKKLDELSKKVGHEQVDIRELQKANAALRKETAAQKRENIEILEADVELRKADARLRIADAKILKASEDVKIKLGRRQADSKRQDDLVGAAKKLISSEINKYLKAHLTEQKELIREEVKNYLSNIAPSPLATKNGKAKSDSKKSSWSELDAFRDGEFCAGTGNSGWNKAFPHLLWYEFPEDHIPARFSFRRGGEYSGEVPKTWQFVASQEENCNQNSAWFELCGDIAGENLVYRADVGCDVPIGSRAPYRCLGIRIDSNTAERTDSAACVSKMRFWEFKY